MPYGAISELPDAVRNNLPQDAQQIYRRAFNNAWDEYSSRTDREATAHKVAWSAVKKKYRKDNGQWVHR